MYESSAEIEESSAEIFIFLRIHTHQDVEIKLTFLKDDFSTHFVGLFHSHNNRSYSNNLHVFHCLTLTILYFTSLEVEEKQIKRDNNIQKSSICYKYKNYVLLNITVKARI